MTSWASSTPHSNVLVRLHSASLSIVLPGARPEAAAKRSDVSSTPNRIQNREERGYERWRVSLRNERPPAKPQTSEAGFFEEGREVALRNEGIRREMLGLQVQARRQPVPEVVGVGSQGKEPTIRA